MGPSNFKGLSPNNRSPFAGLLTVLPKLGIKLNGASLGRSLLRIARAGPTMLCFLFSSKRVQTQSISPKSFWVQPSRQHAGFVFLRWREKGVCVLAAFMGAPMIRIVTYCGCLRPPVYENCQICT